MPEVAYGAQLVATQASGVGQSPVQADFVFQVIADSDMTAYAQFELRLVRQGVVAIVAGVFQAFMTANDRSRHDQPFLQRRSIRRAGIS